jgi:hypothetical protein
MTTHYTIKLTNYKIDFKVTYRDGKFRNIAHLRGKLNQELMNSVGKVLPVFESSLPDFKKKFNGRVSYENLTENKVLSLLQKFTNSWFTFYQQETQLKPKHAGAECNALKSIIKYLKEINDNDDDLAFSSWNLFLSNWNQLGDFHRKQKDLKYISSKLNVLITEIRSKQGTSHKGSVQTANDIADKYF